MKSATKNLKLKKTRIMVDSDIESFEVEEIRDKRSGKRGNFLKFIFLNNLKLN